MDKLVEYFKRVQQFIAWMYLTKRREQCADIAMKIPLHGNPAAFSDQ